MHPLGSRGAKTCDHFTLFSSLSPVLSFAICNAQSAGTQDQVTLIPGDGLPSLESLDINPSQLYNMTLAHIATLESRPRPQQQPPNLNLRPRKINPRNNWAENNPSWTTPLCGTDGFGTAGVAYGRLHSAGYHSAHACYLYLKHLGTERCPVKHGTYTQLCYAHHPADGARDALVSAEVWGGSRQGEVSACEDVAWAVVWVEQLCQEVIKETGDIVVMGWVAAHGNGRIVVLTRASW
ncbi:hypothetical protein B0T16DRAFT_455718 [Cercophora newfieldiana]|uniref:Uncharacterized protein n=1 Tax=Cercophora newfieldiana TaxID=92897 RepID=A0AA40CSY9_9PEZI|nr:hypothetical protein B0T16DRAFT_455718 [Cercophora newfieldiana]